MSTVRFRDPAGSVRTGEWTDDGVKFGGTIYALEDVDVLPPSNPEKIVCVGRNYAKHADEMGSDIPERPLLFLKPPNTLASHGDTITLPAGKDQVDWEGEVGVIIDKQCRHVDAANAMTVVRGFTCMNDISNRDDQRQEQNWVRGKAFDNSAPIGPVVVPPEDIPEDARIELRVNGETKQSSSLSHLIFSIPELIEEITTYMTLEPGDVIATGTPEGVGGLGDGDTVEVECEGVGTLEHYVEQPT